MRTRSLLFAAVVVGAAGTTDLVGCADEAGPGVCVTTHEGLPDQRYRAPTIEDCEEYCASVEGYRCCYYEPDDGAWMAIDGDC